MNYPNLYRDLMMAVHIELSYRSGFGVIKNWIVQITNGKQLFYNMASDWLAAVIKAN